ncbi:MAG: alpha-L-fucosidase [Eubacteriales bacterium]|nr:alpha-L-fucosidase [Eubacteriales bacterium]
MKPLVQLQKAFINLRFGTFIHFNSATVQFCSGELCDWEYDHENAGAPRLYPFAEKDWNPVNLDCVQWAKTAKSAGCRFAALTAKHHEGFALWPSAYTAHCVKNASCQTDVVKAYLDAFRAEGIEAGLYFSILDLTAGIGRKSCTEEQKKMIRGQITELLTNYGEIPFLITDGWNAAWGGPTEDMLPFREIDALVKSLQPNCLLMNIGCTHGVEGTDIVFFENAAGQEVDDVFYGPGISCNKLTKNWFWRATDPDAVLGGSKWVYQKMQEYFPKNVNFMLNLSPAADGRLDQNLVDAFAEIGKDLSLPTPLTELPVGWLTRN